MVNHCDYFVYLEEQQLLVCRSCKDCLQQDGIEQHLRREHRTIPLSTRKELVTYGKNLMLVNPVDVRIYEHVIPAFQYLDIIEVFCCMICDALYGSIESMRVHYSIGHKDKFIEGMSILFSV